MDKALALNRMMRLCARGEHCRADIRRKLAGLPPEEQEQVLETLCRDGYLDDARYARAFARDKSALQGWGNLKISVALQQKAIAPEAIAAALAEIDSAAAGTRCAARAIRASGKPSCCATPSDAATVTIRFEKYMTTSEEIKLLKQRIEMLGRFL